MKQINALFIALIISVSAMAQIETPMPSPTATLEQKVGLTDVKIIYSRPGAKDRVVFGDLVPYGTMWRTGANSSTKISFSDKVMINGKEVPAGTYALYTIPGKDEWTVIIHKNTTHSGTGGDNYKEEEDLMRFQVKPERLNDKVETFTIDIQHNEMDHAKLMMSWENTQIAFEIKAPVNEKIEAMIEQTLNPGGTQYYRAASYYHDSGKELDKALEYINIALEKYEAAGWKPYWVGRRKALILADLGQTKDAIKAAEQSTEWAKAEGADNYVKMNDASIAEWKKK